MQQEILSGGFCFLPFFQVGDSEWSKPFSMDTVGVNQVRYRVVKVRPCAALYKPGFIYPLPAKALLWHASTKVLLAAYSM